MIVLNNNLSLEKRTVTTSSISGKGGVDKTVISCSDNDTLYIFISDGASYTVDGTTVFETVMGGDTRWVGIAGKNNYFTGGSINNFLGQVANKELLETRGAENGYLYHTIADDTIYQFDDDASDFPTDGISVISSFGSTSNKWIAISGKYKYYGDYTRLEMFQVAYNTANTTFPLTTLTFYDRLVGKFNFLKEQSDKYQALNKIIFWEFIGESGYYENDLRFNTINDAMVYINTNLVDTGFVAKGYLKVKNNPYINKVVAYNGFISNIRGRWRLQDKNSATLSQIWTWQGVEYFWSGNDTLLNLIYNDFLGITNGLSYANTRSTIGIPTRYSKLYNLVPAKNAKGKLYQFDGSEGRGRYLFDTNTNTAVSWNDSGTSEFTIKKMYFLDSIVYGQISGNFNSISNIGEFPKINEFTSNMRSTIRVYHLVDNIENPRYHFFMIKPIGVDCFVLPYINNCATNKLGVIIENRQSRRTIKAITNPISSMNEKNIGRNVSFRVEKLDYLSLFNSIEGRTNGMMRFFLYDDNSGMVLNMTEGFNIILKSSGAPFKIMPNRKY